MARVALEKLDVLDVFKLGFRAGKLNVRVSRDTESMESPKDFDVMTTPTAFAYVHYDKQWFGPVSFMTLYQNGIC